MGLAQAAKELLARRGEPRLDVSRVACGALARDQPGALETIYPAREPARAEQHRLGQLTHPEAVAGRFGELNEDVEVAKGEVVPFAQLRVELRDQVGMRHQEVPPSG